MNAQRHLQMILAAPPPATERARLARIAQIEDLEYRVDHPAPRRLNPTQRLAALEVKIAERRPSFADELAGELGACGFEVS